MKFRSTLAVLSLSLSLVCLTPRASFADTLTLTGPTAATGPVVDGVYTYPYQFTVTGPGGSSSGVDMTCLNFNREITFGETWTVDAYNVMNIPTSQFSAQPGSLTEKQFLLDALLYNQYNTGVATNSEIQFAIWSVMDSAVTSGYSGYDSVSSTLVASANATLTSDYANNTFGAFANDEVFLPDTANTSGWTDGTPQIFMVDPPPPSVAPEPSSLILLGTGLLGMCGAARRRLVKA